MRNKINSLILLFALQLATAMMCEAQATEDIVSYYFVELVPNKSSPEFTKNQLMEIQQAHLQNIRNLAQQGKLLLAGPFESGGGIFILNTPLEEEAYTLVQADPAVQAGRFIFTIRKWFTQKGMLSLESQD